MMLLLLFIYPDSYPDMSGYINTHTVHPKRGIKDIKEHLIRIYTQKDSSPQQVLLCTLWYVIC